MFCKECGKEIIDNSKYCIHCGTKVHEIKRNNSVEEVVTPQAIQKIEKVFGFHLSNEVLGFFLAWVLLHLVLLLVNWQSSTEANKLFWPFSDFSKLKHYDFSEFLLYTIVPLIGLIIFNLFGFTVNEKKEVSEVKYDTSVEKQELATFVGIILLIISLVFYLSPDESDYEKAKQIRLISSLVSFIVRIFATTWVIHIAQKLNRNTTICGFLAFIFPSITLIVIGQKRKLIKN